MSKLKFCPNCGKQSAELKATDAFVEVGAYDGKRFEVEGDAVEYQCTTCGEAFYVIKA